MFQAQFLAVGSSSVVIYSPWFPRQGDYLRATAEIVAISGTNANLEIEVFTKKSEDTTNGIDADTGTSISANGAGRGTAEWGPAGSNGISELVRYRFTASGNPGSWVLFRMLPPVWFDAVKS